MAGRNPTSIENIGLNATDNTPGYWYYDRKAGTITYVPRPGETAATLEASATTATQQQLLTLTDTNNIKWEGVQFAYGSWLGASGNPGYIDTQSGYQCQVSMLQLISWNLWPIPNPFPSVRPAALGLRLCELLVPPCCCSRF